MVLLDPVRKIIAPFPQYPAADRSNNQLTLLQILYIMDDPKCECEVSRQCRLSFGTGYLTMHNGAQNYICMLNPRRTGSLVMESSTPPILIVQTVGYYMGKASHGGLQRGFSNIHNPSWENKWEQWVSSSIALECCYFGICSLRKAKLPPSFGQRWRLMNPNHGKPSYV